MGSIGFVKRTIPPQSTQLRTRAYKQLIRPVLEYASCSWDPLPKTLTTQVKAVQQQLLVSTKEKFKFLQLSQLCITCVQFQFESPSRIFSYSKNFPISWRVGSAD